MDAADDAHHHHMHAMSPPPGSSAASPEMMHHKMMMHMTFFWGTNAEILFHRWPGQRSGMYALALIFVFVLAFVVEWLSHCRLIKEDSSTAAAGLIRTLLHTVRIGLAYLVMLAVMSFNVGVFLVAIGGHCLGFFFFGSRFFKKSSAASESKIWRLEGLEPLHSRNFERGVSFKNRTASYTTTRGYRKSRKLGRRLLLVWRIRMDREIVIGLLSDLC